MKEEWGNRISVCYNLIINMTEGKNYLSTAKHWDIERSKGYSSLGWVKAAGPLDQIIKVAELDGNETIIDAGTGSQAVLDTLSSALRNKSGCGRVIGFDVSQSMLLGREGLLPMNSALLRADFYSMPFSDASADIITARQVLHNLSDISEAVLEARRVLRPNGKFIGVEYVAIDPEVLAFERIVFDLKEPGRNLWTGEQFRQIVDGIWNADCAGERKADNVEVFYFNLERYSVLNWMRNSGLPLETQEKIIELYRVAPVGIVEKMRIVCEEEDVFTDRPFAYIVAIK